MNGFQETKNQTMESLEQEKERLEKDVEELGMELEEARQTKQKKQEYEAVAGRALKQASVAEARRWEGLRQAEGGARAGDRRTREGSG